MPAGRFDHAVLDDCATVGLSPPKTYWARPIDLPPFFGCTLRPGVTFTCFGLKVDVRAALRLPCAPRPTLFADGEVMAGNVPGLGYIACVGMTIGTVLGRLAGSAATAAAVAAGSGRAGAGPAAAAGGPAATRGRACNRSSCWWRLPRPRPSSRGSCRSAMLAATARAAA